MNASNISTVTNNILTHSGVAPEELLHALQREVSSAEGSSEVRSHQVSEDRKGKEKVRHPEEGEGWSPRFAEVQASAVFEPLPGEPILLKHEVPENHPTLFAQWERLNFKIKALQFYPADQHQDIYEAALKAAIDFWNDARKTHFQSNDPKSIARIVFEYCRYYLSSLPREVRNRELEEYAEIDFVPIEAECLESIVERWPQDASDFPSEIRRWFADIYQRYHFSNMSTSERAEFLRHHWIPCMLVSLMREGLLTGCINALVEVDSLDNVSLRQLHDRLVQNSVDVKMAWLKAHENSHDLFKRIKHFRQAVEIRLLNLRLGNDKQIIRQTLLTQSVVEGEPHIIYEGLNDLCDYLFNWFARNKFVGTASFDSGNIAQRFSMVKYLMCVLTRKERAEFLKNVSQEVFNVIYESRDGFYSLTREAERVKRTIERAEQIRRGDIEVAVPPALAETTSTVEAREPSEESAADQATTQFVQIHPSSI